MAEAALTLTFRGQTPANGRIPIRDLAPALLALGELLADASVLVDADREPAVLSIDAITAGSPTVHLTVTIADRPDRLTDLLTTDPTSVLAEIHDVVIGPRGLLQLTRAVRDRAIAQREPAAAAGVTRITLEDEATLEARDEAVDLYLDRGARRNANAVVRPLRHRELETLELAALPAPPTVITSMDTDAFDAPATPEPAPVETEVEMLVDVAAPAFPANNKWRLSNGTGSFWATIGDGAFLNRVNAGEPFRKGDLLRCLFKITHRETPLGPQTEHHVLEVLQHVARGQQLRLDEAA